MASPIGNTGASCLCTEGRAGAGDRAEGTSSQVMDGPVEWLASVPGQALPDLCGHLPPSALIRPGGAGGSRSPTCRPAWCSSPARLISHPVDSPSQQVLLGVAGRQDRGWSSAPGPRMPPKAPPYTPKPETILAPCPFPNQGPRPMHGLPRVSPTPASPVSHTSLPTKAPAVQY